MVYALKDPIGGNLDRIQIIKGWLDGSGKTQEKVYDVASSGDRKAGADGKLPAVGNTVDAKTASFRNTIGRFGARSGLDGSRFRRLAKGFLLRSGDRDPNATVVDV